MSVLESSLILYSRNFVTSQQPVVDRINVGLPSSLLGRERSYSRLFELMRVKLSLLIGKRLERLKAPPTIELFPMRLSLLIGKRNGLYPGCE
mmetsp:Transcript_71675/g.201027  ORF Transcript_71675/g.201027 Transcript_71675/m.201027 type:complete len:92 (+) Transcript_71675:114-389(+)